MISSHICVDCICLPACLSKTGNRLLGDCVFIINALTNISCSIRIDSSLHIHFKSLDRTIEVCKSSFILYARLEDLRRRHILKFMSADDDDWYGG